jgi:hypothetical protein
MPPFQASCADLCRQSCTFLWSHLSQRSRKGSPAWILTWQRRQRPVGIASLCPTDVVWHSMPGSIAPSLKQWNESDTHFAETLRYMLDGVRNSAGMEEKTGTRFGGLGDVTAAASTSRMVSSDGWTTNCRPTRSVPASCNRAREDK